MPNPYQENKQYFQRAYQNGEYPWAKGACTVVEKYLDFVVSKGGHGEFLDIGCGEGANVRMATEKGFSAIGLDQEYLAVQNARQITPRERQGLSANFLSSDALSLPFKPQSFNVILDHGCFHHIRQKDWDKYLDNIRLILRPKGYYILEVFSLNHKGYGEIPASRTYVSDGVYRRFFNEDDIRQLWQKEFNILDIQEKHGPIAGDWHVLMQKKS